MAVSYKNSDLTAFQDYVRTYQDDLMSLGLVGAPSLKYFTPFQGIKGQHIITYDQFSDIVKRFAVAFAPDADTYTAKPATIASYATKAEIQFSPKQDFANYRAYLVKTKQKADDYPYTQYILEKASKKIQTQIEFDQLFTGDQNLGGDTAADMFTGLLTTIADDQAEITPVLTPVTTGVLTAGNIIASVEAVDDAYDLERRDENMVMLASDPVFKLYRRAYRLAAGYHPNNEDTDAMNEIMLDGSTTKLVRCPGMGTSQRLILTPERNLYIAYDADNDAEMWEFEGDHRYMDAWCDYWFGAGFILLIPEIVVINDQA